MEVTYRCELNCIHCSSDACPSNTLEMRLEDCRRILSEAIQMGAREVAFSGGEPLTWAHLPDAVETARAGGLNVTVYTSGVVEGFQEKVALLFQRGAGRMIFSVFGGTAPTHERVTRVAGSFKKTCESIVEAKRLGLAVETHFVPMSSNYRELKEVTALSNNLGANTVSVLRLVPQGRASLLQSRTLNRVQNCELRRQIVELREAGNSIRVGSPYNFLMVNDSPACRAAIDRVIIGPDLRVYPCDAFKQVKAEELTGSLNHSSLHHASLRDCWEKSPFLKAIRTYLTTRFSEACTDCQQLDRCLSGCLAQKVIASGFLRKGPDPDCLRASKDR